MTDSPQTREEWAEYIQNLKDEDLWSQAVAANSQEFAQELRKEGFTIMDVKAIVQLFAKQLTLRRLKLPEGGAYDMPLLARL